MLYFTPSKAITVSLPIIIVMIIITVLIIIAAQIANGYVVRVLASDPSVRLVGRAVISKSDLDGTGDLMKKTKKTGSFCSEKMGNYKLPMKCQGGFYFSTYTFQFRRFNFIPAVKLGIIKGIKKNSIRYKGFHVFFQLRKVRPGSISSRVRTFGTRGTTGSFRELAELRQAVFKS